MVLQGYPQTSAKLANGELVFRNGKHLRQLGNQLAANSMQTTYTPHHPGLTEMVHSPSWYRFPMGYILTGIGTPYVIARIIEFLPANTTPRKPGGRPAPVSEMQVRLSIYYRPSDVS